MTVDAKDIEARLEALERMVVTLARGVTIALEGKGAPDARAARAAAKEIAGIS